MKVWVFVLGFGLLLAGGMAMADEQPAEGRRHLEERLKIVPLSRVWKFKTDLDDVGLKQKWYALETDDSGWAEVRSGKNYGWESQGFPGYTGHGWYRQRVKVPKDIEKRKSFYLCFGAVDEDAEVYINGKKAFEHTWASTGLTPGEIWITPFAFDPRPLLRPGKENLIAVRVYNRQDMGGIWKPVYWVSSDTQVTATAIVEMMRKKVRPSDARPTLPVPSYVVVEGMLDTGVMGGVEPPSAEDLAAMHKGQYIFHARGGKLTKVPAQKSLLPHDPMGHVQILEIAMAPDGTVYVNQNSIMCKSTDAGRTWTSYARQDSPQKGGKPIPDTKVFHYNKSFDILSDGTFVMNLGYDSDFGGERIVICTDEGRTWREISRFKIPPKFKQSYVHSMTRLPDDVLLLLIECRGHEVDRGAQHVPLFAYRSTDKGMTWKGPSRVGKGSEGGVAVLPSGKLLAAIRRGDAKPIKHLFLADSDDGGVTWKNYRQLTTVYGQCYGYPVALADGRVVVVHDTRYGPGPPSGRAIVSHDRGTTWQNEVYYLYYGSALSGYANSVLLKDGTVLTIAGSSEHEPAKYTWNEAIGHSDLTAIRWRPGKD